MGPEEPWRDENHRAGAGRRRLGRRRSEVLAWSAAAAFASLVVVITIDAATGGGISVRADVTLALAGGMLGGLWRELPRAAPAELRGSVRGLLIVATTCFALVGGVYLLLHRSVFGQRFERDGLLGSAIGGVLRAGAREVLDLVTIGTVLLVAAVLCAIAVSRGSTGHAGVVASTLVASVASAEVFKAVLFPRPNLLGGDAVATATSFPSGTVAAMSALGVGLVSVAPPAWRRSASHIGMSITAAAGISVLLLGWHRASDAVGGLALAFGWFAIGLAVLRTYRPDEEDRADRVSSIPRPWTVVAYLTAVGVVLVAIVELSRDGEPARPVQIAAFLAGCLLFLAADIAGYAVLARAARRPRRAST